MIRIGEKGVPIINLSDIVELAGRYGLPVAPEPLPDIPHGEVYSELRYRMPLAIAVLIVYAAVVFVAIRVDVTSVLFRKKK